ncbi:MAG TPA: hypothetical protein PL037_01585, partial [Elusimicrobiales bacterium]|nr:hypothetical protein [Elusimicrobiales bacterium]
MEKKNSIFSSLGPALSPQSGAMSRSQPVQDQEVSALRQKVETLERALAAQERKLAESRGAPPPPPPPRQPDVNAQFLLAKISELDRKLEEYARTAMLSSAQMKNVEESKISARREIEDLLKVVREQQKYSEMDRQMHDQLEKSWRRVEELEKKLMDFYGAVLSRSAEEGKKAPPLQGGEVENIVDSKLRSFLEKVDERFRAISEKLDSQTPAMMRKTEQRLADMVNDLDSRLTAFEIDFKKLHLYISSTEESINS